MKFTVGLLKQILPNAKFVSLSDDKYFDYLNVSKISAFDSLKHDEVLYFCVYEDRFTEDGWYENNFDRALNVEKMMKKGITFVVDLHTPLELVDKVPYIFVPNIFDAISEIRSYVLQKTKATVVGVTGSVGKTTTVAMLEDVLNVQNKKCIRFYSKRLTPLTLSSWIVNFVENDTDFIVLEYSMYRKEHIEMLKKIISPNISIFLNLRPIHLGVLGINTIEDIAQSKSKLFTETGINISNGDEHGWNSVLPRIDYNFGISGEKSISTDLSSKEIIKLKYKNDEIEVIPYIKTKLFLYQLMVSVLIGKILGIDRDSMIESLNKFKPEENRINWQEFFGSKVIFDGDITYAGRLDELGNNYYDESRLIIHCLDFGIEDIHKQRDSFLQMMNRFKTVSILADENNLKLLSQYNLNMGNIEVVSETGIIELLKSECFIVYHYGGFFRKYRDTSVIETLLKCEPL